MCIILRWLDSVQGNSYEEPESFKDLKLKPTAITQTHLNEVKQRIDFLRQERQKNTGILTTSLKPIKPLKSQKEKSYLEITRGYENSIRVIEGVESTADSVLENEEKTCNNNSYKNFKKEKRQELDNDEDLMKKFFRKNRLRKFYSFDTFDSDINSVKTSYLNHVLSIYNQSSELRDKQKKFFNYFDKIYSILNSKKNVNAKLKMNLIKQKIIIYKILLEKRLGRNRFLRKLYQRIKEINLKFTKHACDNYCLVYTKEYQEFIHKHLNTHRFDVGYQFLTTIKLKLIFNWLRTVNSHKSTISMKAPKSYVDLTRFTPSKQNLEFKSVTLTNREEVCLRLFGSKSFTDFFDESSRAYFIDKLFNNKSVLGNLLLHNVAFSILLPLGLKNFSSRTEENSEYECDSLMYSNFFTASESTVSEPESNKNFY